MEISSAPAVATLVRNPAHGASLRRCPNLRTGCALCLYQPAIDVLNLVLETSRQLLAGRASPGILPAERMVMIFFRISNQKGAPREVAKAVTSHPRT